MTEAELMLRIVALIAVFLASGALLLKFWRAAKDEDARFETQLMEMRERHDQRIAAFGRALVDALDQRRDAP